MDSNEIDAILAVIYEPDLKLSLIVIIIFDIGSNKICLKVLVKISIEKGEDLCGIDYKVSNTRWLNWTSCKGFKKDGHLLLSPVIYCQT